MTTIDNAGVLVLRHLLSFGLKAGLINVVTLHRLRNQLSLQTFSVVIQLENIILGLPLLQQ